MSLLFRVVFTNCRSTHHKMAMDALRFLRGPEAEQWTDLFLKHYVVYLDGSKAPDDQFKDFKNHVLHVRDNFWGGAIGAAQKWYDRTVALMRHGDWEEGVFAAGVLSHYFTDPHMPLHTGQSEAEGAVHRAAEWSITKSYHELQNILEVDHGGYPRLEVPAGDDWLAEMIRQGALRANPHYEVFIDHYNLAQGLKEPTLGLDQELKDRTAQCLGFATVGFARVLERALEDAGVRPPLVDISLQGVLTTMALPVHWITSHIIDGAEREQIRAIYNELQVTGKVLKNLPEDEKVVRKLHAAEVLHKSMADLNAEPIRQPGKAYGQGAKDRYRSNAPVTRNLAANKPRGNAKQLLQTPLSPLEPLDRTTSSRRRRRKGYAPSNSSKGGEVAARLAENTIPPSETEDSVAMHQTAAESKQDASVDAEDDSYVTDTLASLESNALLRDIPKRRRPADLDAEGEDRRSENNNASEDDAPRAPSRLKQFFSPIWNKLSGLRKRPAEAEPTKADDEREEAAAPRQSKSHSEKPKPRYQEMKADRDEEEDDDPRQAESPRVTRLQSPPPAASEKTQKLESLHKEAASKAAPANAPSSRRLRFHLEQDDDVEQAPSIGNKTAERLKSLGVRTVKDLLTANPDSLSSRLKAKHITPQVVRDWQTQADLASRIPELRGHDAQILVGSGISDPREMESLEPEELLELIQPYVSSEEGERNLRGGAAPDLVEVTNWISWAKQARHGKAA